MSDPEPRPNHGLAELTARSKRGPEPLWPPTPTWASERRSLLVFFSIALFATTLWWATLFLLRRPAIDYLCICIGLPFFFAGLWSVIGWELLKMMRRFPEFRRRSVAALTLLAFLLAPYSLLRAGSDMFSLSVRYHLWRAGGADKVRNAFNQWVASRPFYDASNGRKLLFSDLKSGGSIERLSPTELPTEVRYINARFPSRFGMTWDDVAKLDNVYVLTTTDIMIGPPGWEPDGDLPLWRHLTGSRRQLADGIWIWFGTYDK